MTENFDCSFKSCKIYF